MNSKNHVYKCPNRDCLNHGKREALAFTPSEVRAATGYPCFCKSCGDVMVYLPGETLEPEPAAPAPAPAPKPGKVDLAAVEAPILYNGIYTISSPRGGHKTFRIHRVARGKLEGKRIVAILSGPENCTDYQGFGFVEADGAVRVWRKKQQPKPDGSVSAWVVYADMLKSLALHGEAGRYHKMGYRLHVARNCLRCNRLLTTPESIRAGIGPICAGKGF
jgi:hypothetical protein